jgi:hypothetical protein
MHLSDAICANDKPVDMMPDGAFEGAFQVTLALHIKKLSLET